MTVTFLVIFSPQVRKKFVKINEKKEEKNHILRILNCYYEVERRYLTRAPKVVVKCMEKK